MEAEPAGALRYSNLGARVNRAEPVITRLMTEALARPGVLSLAAGFTDNSVLPVERVREAVGRIAAGAPDREFLQYGLNVGRPGLRDAVIELLRGYPDEPLADLDRDHVVITNGSQQALYISAQLFCDPGDIVLVEAPSYFVFLELLAGLGLRPLSMPARADGGIDTDALRTLLATLRARGDLKRVKLLYYMGTFANPSTRCVEEADKVALARVLREQDIAIPVIEDMAYRELYFEHPHAARSVLSVDAWNGLPVLYAGTFTKPFATGMKVGFVCGRELEWLRNLARIKGHQDFGTANFTQAIIEDVCLRGEYPAHLAGLRPHYREKMDTLERVLRTAGLPEVGWSWHTPRGGLLLWLRGPNGLDTRIGSPFCEACLAEDVLYVPGDLCFAEGAPHNFVRLSFGALEMDQLVDAAGRFARAALKHA